VYWRERKWENKQERQKVGEETWINIAANTTLSHASTVSKKTKKQLPSDLTSQVKF
jgi:hypothetical protein